MSELLTTGQMIDKLKDGEIAEGVGNGFYSGYQVRKTEYGEIVPVEVKGLENSNFLALSSICMKTKWRILPKHVSFEEAKQAYENGKRIKCEYVSAISEKEIREQTYKEGMPEYEGALSWYLVINGKWSIED